MDWNIFLQSQHPQHQHQWTNFFISQRTCRRSFVRRSHPYSGKYWRNHHVDHVAQQPIPWKIKLSGSLRFGRTTSPFLNQFRTDIPTSFQHFCQKWRRLFPSWLPQVYRRWGSLLLVFSCIGKRNQKSEGVQCWTYRLGRLWNIERDIIQEPFWKSNYIQSRST